MLWELAVEVQMNGRRQTGNRDFKLMSHWEILTHCIQDLLPDEILNPMFRKIYQNNRWIIKLLINSRTKLLVYMW